MGGFTNEQLTSQIEAFGKEITAKEKEAEPPRLCLFHSALREPYQERLGTSSVTGVDDIHSALHLILIPAGIAGKDRPGDGGTYAARVEDGHGVLVHPDHTRLPLVDPFSLLGELEAVESGDRHRGVSVAVVSGRSSKRNRCVRRRDGTIIDIARDDWRRGVFHVDGLRAATRVSAPGDDRRSAPPLGLARVPGRGWPDG